MVLQSARTVNQQMTSRVGGGWQVMADCYLGLEFGAGIKVWVGGQ
jgi:hypothetical protein